jgi:hypothetical protein
MNQHKSNQKTLVAVHGYSGDAAQIEMLMPLYEHHKCPILILSPDDAPIRSDRHPWRTGGKRAYIGQDSLDRQYIHYQKMLETDADFFLWNDSDSICLAAEIPQVLYDNPDTVFSNQVDDFRRPGERYVDAANNIDVTWPTDYHAGFPLIAKQPPYFLSRVALQRIVDTCQGIQACPITPFIDWYVVQCVVKAGLKHSAFPDGMGASCETVTPHGVAVMRQQVAERNATFIHAIKRKEVKDEMLALYNKKHNINQEWRPHKSHY